MVNLSLSDEAYEKKKFFAIDGFKFIFSIAIISLHYPASFLTENVILNCVNTWFARLAVPFFFIASGYFLFKKLKYENAKEKKQIVKAYLKKIGKMYLVWSLINLPLVINSYKGCSASYIIKKILFVGTYRQFWYLLALLIDIPLIYYLNQKLSAGLILWISITLFLFGTFGFEFYDYAMQIPILKDVYGMIYDVLILPRNAIFFGFCFVAIGNFFANAYFYLSMKKAIFIFILTTITVMIENIIFTKTSYLQMTDMRMSLLPLCFSFFYIVAHIELKPRKIYLLMRNMSLLIYCSHCMWAECIPLFLKQDITMEQQYICGVVFSLIFAFLVTKMREVKTKNLGLKTY